MTKAKSTATRHHFEGEIENLASKWNKTQVRSFHEQLSDELAVEGLDRPSDKCFSFRPSIFTDGAIELFYYNDDMLPPFEDGMVLDEDCRNLSTGDVMQITQSLKILKNPEAAARDYKLSEKYLSGEFQRYNLKRYDIYPYGFALREDKTLGITVALDVEILDDTARTAGMTFLYTLPGNMGDWHLPKELKDHLIRQEERKKTGFKGEIMIDKITANFLKKKIEGRRLKRIVDGIIEPVSPAKAAHADTDVADRFKMPDEIVTARIINGQVISRIKLDDGIYLYAGKDESTIELVNKGIPEAALVDAAGKRLNQIIESGLFTSDIIITKVESLPTDKRMSEGVVSFRIKNPLVKLTGIVPKGRIPKGETSRQKALRFAKEKAAMRSGIGVPQMV